MIRFSNQVTTAAIILTVLAITIINVYLFNENYTVDYVHDNHGNYDDPMITVIDDNKAVLDTDIPTRTRTRTRTDKTQYAMDIVRRAFHETFAAFVDLCPQKKQIPIKDCIAQIYKEIIINRNTTDKSYNNTSMLYNGQHWWFQSMMRDAASMDGTNQSGLHGPWHIGQASNPNITMCMIEKVGTKQWSTLFSILNTNGTNRLQLRPNTNNEVNVMQLPVVVDKDDDDDDDDDDDYEYDYTYRTFLFLRDPLDRFLSAYIDKCVDQFHKKMQNHCEPNEVTDTSNTQNLMLAGFSYTDDDADGSENIHKRAMFSAYVDTMPLKWNLHFFPQSLYCNGLYRFLPQYDFVGYMDRHFYHRLSLLGKRYGGRFEETLQDIFHYTSKINLNAEDNNNVGIETKASDKVKQYYTPRSLRRVLEYVSIDYMLLNMTIPDWAEEMLKEDEEKNS